MIPLSGHQVRLTWTGSTGTTGGYYVEFNPHGSNWPAEIPAGNKKQVFVTDLSTDQYKTCLDFDLDSMITRGDAVEDEDRDGLADHAAYDIRVRASKTVSQQTVEYVSDTITIIDTPITKADGYVPESPTNPTVGQADVTWTTLTSVLGNQYAGGQYILRPRRLAHDPASESWRPNAYAATNPDDIAPTNATEQTIGGLTPDEIYAIQLIYLPDGDANTRDTKVFSGRNVYAWLSDDPLLSVSGTRTTRLLAGFWLWKPIDYTTYEYHVCADTFTKKDDTQLARDRRQAWIKYIVHAFSQWDLATHHVVSTLYRGNACTDYGSLVQAAVQALVDAGVLEGSDTDDRAAIEAALERFIQNRWHLDIVPKLNDDSDVSEVMMFDDFEAYAEDGPLYFAFTEAMSSVPIDPADIDGRQIGKFGNHLGFVASHNCWGPSVKTEAKACAVPSKRATGAGDTTDIVLLRTQVDHDPLVIPGGNEDRDGNGLPDVDPGDVTYNMCPDIVPNSVWLPVDAQDRKNDDSVYGTLVHEAGHALGIPHPVGNVYFTDSVMTPGVTFGCSPHSLDVLAVDALYRAR